MRVGAGPQQPRPRAGRNTATRKARASSCRPPRRALGAGRAVPQPLPSPTRKRLYSSLLLDYGVLSNSPGCRGARCAACNPRRVPFHRMQRRAPRIWRRALSQVGFTPSAGAGMLIWASSFAPAIVCSYRARRGPRGTPARRRRTEERRTTKRKAPTMIGCWFVGVGGRWRRRWMCPVACTQKSKTETYIYPLPMPATRVPYTCLAVTKTAARASTGYIVPPSRLPGQGHAWMLPEL